MVLADGSDDRQIRLAAVRRHVEKHMREVRIVDLHTHLFPACFGELCLSGPDDLLTYHYLIAEVLRFTRERPETFLARPKAEQADVIWKTLFVDRAPISEAASGVTATFVAYGLDPEAKDLSQARAFFSNMSIGERIDRAFDLAGVQVVAMTNDPLHPLERPHYESGFRGDSRFRTALRIDPVVLEERGDFAWIRAYVQEWSERIDARYVAVSLPPDLSLDGDSPAALRLRHAVLPVLQSCGLPIALMIGVRRRVNPRIDLAGDGMGVANLDGLASLLRDFSDVPFLVTTLARENVHELCVLARKFANLIPFGCWWFVNNPSLVKEITTLRLEMLGTSFIPQHSDARVLEQIVYKWAHSRRIVEEALLSRYFNLIEDGINISEIQVASDVGNLMRENSLAALNL